MSHPFMQVYVADYTADTQHLSCEEDGAYWRLIRAMWRAGGSLPSDQRKLARICGLAPARWAKVRLAVLEFFDESNGVLTQGRLLRELEKAEEKSIKRSEAGKLGGEAKALKSNKSTLANTSRLLKHSLEPEPEKNSVTTVTAQIEDVDLDPDAQAWALGVELLTKRGGLTERQARAFLGGLFKRHAIRASELLVALIGAEDSGTLDLQPYLHAAAQGLRGLRLVHARGPPSSGELAIAAREEGRRRLLAEDDDGDQGRNHQGN